jgi:hypothetical protein
VEVKLAAVDVIDSDQSVRVLVLSHQVSRQVDLQSLHFTKESESLRILGFQMFEFDFLQVTLVSNLLFLGCVFWSCWGSHEAKIVAGVLQERAQRRRGASAIGDLLPAVLAHLNVTEENKCGDRS